MREQGCPMCGIGWKPLNYKIDGIMMCEECYIQTKISRNMLDGNSDLQSNTFRVMKNDKAYNGIINGYQCRKGFEDKYYLYMNINEANFSIWYDNWFTKQEIAKSCDGWNIDIQELLK